LVGITALGAAPSFGQSFPEVVVIENSPLRSGIDFNGTYIMVSAGTPDNTAGVVWMRYGINPNSPPYITFAGPTDFGSVGGYRVRLHSAWPGSNRNEAVVGQSALWTPTQRVTNWTGVGIALEGGGLALFYGTADDLDPYYNEFPDWESAAVKIPLGFTFGMTFWAAAVALTISLKWVRDLASAAS
jgi:hypothetical protein